ncbi:MAG: hypothetical protein KBC84_05470 [Proteobacteria bacterium]|nr:hypothetical protein [Pseudomonadota bacterium]
MLNLQSKKEPSQNPELVVPKAPEAKKDEWKLSEHLSKSEPIQTAEYLAYNYLIALGIKGGKGFDENHIMVTPFKGEELEGKVRPPQSQISYSYVEKDGTAVVQNAYVRINNEAGKLQIEYSKSPITETDGKSSGLVFKDFININKDYLGLTNSAKDIIRQLDQYIDIANKAKEGKYEETNADLEKHHKTILKNDIALIKAAEAEYDKMYKETLETIRKLFFPFKVE